MADLCALDDVVGYAPGYDQADPGNADTNTKLSALIRSESVEIWRRTGREFVAIAPALDPRVFDVDCRLIDSRRLRIGAAAAITAVVQKRSGSTVQTFTLDSDAVRLPRVRQPWEPYTHLWFPELSGTPALFIEEDTIEITATWGYPDVPADIKEACAKLVVVRYITDVAAGGTAFADAVTANGDINLGGLFRDAEDVIEGYGLP